MATWPSGTKASATTTAADTNSISGARGDINQTITNQNSIIDMFNIPASPTDNYILVYNSATSQFDVEANTAANEVVDDTSPQLGADLQVNDFDISNSDGSNRGDAFVIGSNSAVETSTSTIVSGIDTDLDIMSGSTDGIRIAGPVTQTKISDLNTWNDRVHSNCTATKIELTDNFGESGSGSERGKTRIRNGYHDITLNTKGYQFGDFAFERFGDGLNAGFFSAKAFTDVDNNTAHAHTVRAVTLAPQADGSAATLTSPNTFTVNKLIGAEIVPFVDDDSVVNNFYGVRINVIDSGSQATVTGTITNKFSFYSDNDAYTLQNDGPAILKGLSYPTSDGTSGQVIKTDGSGNLSFTNLTTTDIYYNGGTLASDGATTTPNYNDGNFIRYEVTRDNGVGGGVKLNAPSNMSDGNTMWLAFEATAGTAGQSAIVAWNTGQNIYDNTTSYTITSGKTLLLRVVRIAGPKYLSQNDNLYDASAI